jgi:hypothetical protein
VGRHDLHHVRRLPDLLDGLGGEQAHVNVRGTVRRSNSRMQ